MLALPLLALAVAQPPATPSPLGVQPPAAAKPLWPKEIGGKELKLWVADLSSPDPAVRDAAITVIPLFGPDARGQVLDPLLLMIGGKERDPGVRVHVIDLLGNVGAATEAEAKKIVGALALALSNSAIGGPSRLHLIRALSNYGPQSYSAVGAVASALSDTAWETRRAAAFALGRIALTTDATKNTVPSANALKALAGTFNDPATPVRLEVTQSLILLGPPGFDAKDPNGYATAVKPHLEAVTAAQKKEKDKGVWIWQQVLVMRLDGSQLTEANVKKIADYVTGNEVGARLHALTALAMLGDRAKPFVPVMALALKLPEPEVVTAAVSALAALGEAAKGAIPELTQLKDGKIEPWTKDDSKPLRELAGHAIDAINGKKPPAPPPPPKK